MFSIKLVMLNHRAWLNPSPIVHHPPVREIEQIPVHEDIGMNDIDVVHLLSIL